MSPPTASPTATLGALRASTAALLRGIDVERWTDAEVRAPSVLPGWTRGHVLTHLARNADGISRTLSGALRGEILARYPGGTGARNADIEAGATRGFAELAADVRDSADRLDRLLGAVADADGWELPTEDRAAREYVTARWREVEIHRVDLGGAYTPDEWPAAFVGYLLPELAEDLARRGTGAVRIEVAAGGSVCADLAGRCWSAGAGEPIDVIGPDWALAAWLTGRGSTTAGALNRAPDVANWL